MKIKELMKFLKQSFIDNKKIFLIVLLKSVFLSFSSLFLVVGLGTIVEQLLDGNNLISLLQPIFLYSFIPLIINLIATSLTFYIDYLTRISTNKIQYDYVDDALTVNYHYVQDGEILNLKRRSMSGHTIFYIDIIGQLLQQFFQIIGTIFLFSFMSPWYIIAIFIIQIIIIYLNYLKRKISFNFNNDITDSNRKLDYIYHVMTDYKYGKDIRINKGEPLLVQKANDICQKHYQISDCFYKKSHSIQFFYDFARLLLQIILYAYLTYLVFLSKITLSQYTILIGASFLFNNCIDQLSISYFKILDSLKYESILNEYKSIIGQKSDIHRTNLLDEISFDNKPFTLSFVDVSFTYPESNTEILKNINLEIKNNENIGIIGLNGAGKTTLIKLILRLYKPTKGKILLNKIDIQTIPLHQYLSFIGVVLQDYFIFAYSIKENIVFHQKENEKRLKQCIQESGLAEKINKLPYALDTVLYKELNDDGIELSGGENQKLAIARALYKQSKILIMDEPTSTLDPLAEHDIFTKFQSMTNNKLSILISHRLSFTAFCNKIYVLENGTIIEGGNHNELMINQKRYYELYMTQIHYYEEKENE